VALVAAPSGASAPPRRAGRLAGRGGQGQVGQTFDGLGRAALVLVVQTIDVLGRGAQGVSVQTLDALGQAEHLGVDRQGGGAGDEVALGGGRKAREVGVQEVHAAGLAPAGQVAVRFALAQVGKPYVYGGTGPYGYDCSGLALASWGSAGVTLPRTAAEQYWSGAHVPVADVQPGDLVFWASDPADPATIYHVALALGQGEVVMAPVPGESVEVVHMWGPGLVPLATVP
jgi:cell wall-associated NlpC family hydrolase